MHVINACLTARDASLKQSWVKQTEKVTAFFNCHKIIKKKWTVPGLKQSGKLFFSRAWGVDSKNET